MSAMLAPLSICQQPAQKSAHDCCAPKSQASVRPDCCTVSAPLAAIVVKPSQAAPTAIAVEREFVASNEFAVQHEIAIFSVTPPQSPPPGAFNLRI